MSAGDKITSVSLDPGEDDPKPQPDAPEGTDEDLDRPPPRN